MAAPSFWSIASTVTSCVAAATCAFLAVEVHATKADVAQLHQQIAALSESLGNGIAEQRQELENVHSLARETARKQDEVPAEDPRWDTFSEEVENLTRGLEKTEGSLATMTERLGPDRTSDTWQETVGPSVQLAGEATVGSGVLLQSQPIGENSSRFQTLLITSWHVVRDIRADAGDADAPIPVMLRDSQGRKRNLTATLVAFDTPLDAALLVVDSDAEFENGALLPTRERLRAVRIFDPIIAVGCPLGNDPIPTRGHVSDTRHTVSSEHFWMISAPVYIGNSGGGIFSSRSHELIGIFSKIYTHGSIRPTVIPHMGLVTPMIEYYDWIEGIPAAGVIESDGRASIVLR